MRVLALSCFVVLTFSVLTLYYDVGMAEKNTKYQKSFDHRAYHFLSTTLLSTRNDLCSLFGCPIETILDWMAEHPSFNHNVVSGINDGERRFKKLLLKMSMLPSSTINTKLITMLSQQAYGYAAQPNVAVNNINTNTANATSGGLESAEEILKKRGIPIPKIGIEDIE